MNDGGGDDSIYNSSGKLCECLIIFKLAKLYRTLVLFLDLRVFGEGGFEVTVNRAHFWLYSFHIWLHKMPTAMTHHCRNRMRLVITSYTCMYHQILSTSSAPKPSFCGRTGCAPFTAQNIVVGIIHEICVTHNKRMMTIQMNSPLLFRIITSFCGFGEQFCCFLLFRIFFAGCQLNLLLHFHAVLEINRMATPKQLQMFWAQRENAKTRERETKRPAKKRRKIAK